MKIVREDRNASHRSCPSCGKLARREHGYQRRLHDVGDLVSGRPVELHISYLQHHCKPCKQYFMTDLSDVAPPGSHNTYRAIGLAVRVVVEDGLAYRNASWHLWRDHRVFVPFATIQYWVEAGEKSASAQWESEYLTWALSDFSGYQAADELYSEHLTGTPIERPGDHQRWLGLISSRHSIYLG